MVKITVRGVLKTEPSGGRCWVGYVPIEQEVEGLLTSPVDVLDPEDESGNFWVLAKDEPIPLMDEEALDDLRAGELARAAKAKLTDAELTALGLTRE